MNPTQQAKIKQFINDPSMEEAVFTALLNSFLSETSKDVTYLAASRISVDLLKKAWRLFASYRINPKRKEGVDNPSL